MPKLLILLIVGFFSLGSSLKENEKNYFFSELESKVKVKIDYFENPINKDFFTKSLPGKYTELGPFEKLKGFWSGVYDLSKESIFWMHPDLENYDVYRIIKFGPYNINIKFETTESGKLTGLDIIQEDIGYGSVNIELADKKQINYWAKATSSTWLEIIRGKLLKVSDNELYTEFLTVVYEKRTPIYAFKGNSILRKK